MADREVLLGRERFAGELEMLKRKEEENVHRVYESLADYTKLGTMNPVAFDERRLKRMCHDIIKHFFNENIKKLRIINLKNSTPHFPHSSLSTLPFSTLPIFHSISPRILHKKNLRDTENQQYLRKGIQGYTPEGYLGFQVTGMIEWSQKSRPKKISRASSKTQKIPGQHKRKKSKVH